MFTILCPILLLSCHEANEKTIETRGIYGNPKPLWDKEIDLTDLGINAIFVHSGSINHEMVKRAKSEGLKVFAEFATLNGKSHLEAHPEAWPINDKGEREPAASWFMGACPTEPGFRKFRFGQLRKLLIAYDLNGVWLDYLHWHAQFEEPEPILPETCFCEHCLDAFSKHSQLKIPVGSTAAKASWILNQHDETWRKWRSKVISDWTEEAKSMIKEIRPNALLGLYHCPWYDEEFNDARRRILGLDFDLLRETVDVFSPMVYHERMGRNPQWVAENIQWFSDRLNIGESPFPKLWPIVQAHNSPGIISSDEFETVLMGGLQGQSSGVMMFTTSAIAEDPEKTEVVKDVYISLQEKGVE